MTNVDQLVVTAIEQRVNSLANFDVESATRVVTVKMVGYTEVVRVLHSRFGPDASVVLFGGLAKDRPYPGSTMVSAFNGGITALVRTLALELAPYRINAVHPGVVGDSPKWRDVVDHPHVQRTPLGGWSRWRKWRMQLIFSSVTQGSTARTSSLTEVCSPADALNPHCPSTPGMGATEWHSWSTRSHG